MSKIKIVYGTGGGNTKIVCDEVTRLLKEKGHEVEMLLVKNAEPADVGEFDLLILAAPTHGHGEMEQYMDVFLKKLEAVDMKGWKCTIIGLGDPKYDDDYHLEGIRIMMMFLKEKGAELVGMPLRITKSPFQWLDNLVVQWVEKLDVLING